MFIENTLKNIHTNIAKALKCINDYHQEHSEDANCPLNSLYRAEGLLNSCHQWIEGEDA